MKAFPLPLALGLSSVQAAFAADVTAQPKLTLEGAKRAVAAQSPMRALTARLAQLIAAVDPGEHTICLDRLDGTFLASADVSIGNL